MSVPFHMPEPIEITVDLPFPPSTNRIWRQKRGGVYTAPAYAAWVKNCDAHILMARSKRTILKHMIMGPCEAEILLNIDKGIGDLDNRLKAVLDFAQRIELIHDDKLVMHLHAAWVIPSRAPVGCRLTLRELAG